MKSYILPAIIGASVIAIATLIYAVMLPSAPLTEQLDTLEQTEVIEKPADGQQTTVSVVKDSADDEAKNADGGYKLLIDIARVQADGMAVFAGRGAPNGSIFITENGKIFAQNTIDEQGQWVVLPEEALAPGAHLLELEMVSQDGVSQRADVSLVVQISSTADEKPLVALVPQSDNQTPTLLQTPDESKAQNKTADKTTDTIGQTQVTQADEVAEILGQGEVFIQIGSLSWGDDKQLSIHGVASGGDMVTGMMANLSLEPTGLAETGRWSSKLNGNPFVAGDRQLLEVMLRGANDEVIARSQLMVSQSQLSAGLDGSLMVVVHKGDALWRIAYRSYGQGVRYVDILRRNSSKIDDPDLIYPNQIFAVPGVKN